MSMPFGQAAGNDGTGSVDNGGEPTYGGGGDQQQGNNPAWNEFLQVIPQELHEKVTPLLQKWDQGVNDRFQKVHSEYEPWKDITKSTDPETTRWALNVLNALNENPKMVYDALGDWMKDSGIDAGQIQQAVQQQQQGLSTGQGQQGPEDPYKQQFDGLQQQVRLMTEFLQAQQQNQESQQMDYQVAQEFDAASKKYGLSPQDEQFVSGLVLQNPGISIDQAAQQFNEFRNQVAQTHRPAPLIMGSGGGLPGQGIDPTKLDGKGTKDLVVQMLNAAKAQNQ